MIDQKDKVDTKKMLKKKKMILKKLVIRKFLFFTFEHIHIYLDELAA